MSRDIERELLPQPRPAHRAAVVELVEAGEPVAPRGGPPSGESMIRMAGLLLLGLALALSPDPDDEEPIEEDNAIAAQSLLNEFALTL